MYSANSGGGGVGDAEGVENGENEFGGAAKATTESDTMQAIIWRVFMPPNVTLLEANAKWTGRDFMENLDDFRKAERMQAAGCRSQVQADLQILLRLVTCILHPVAPS
jgi:hypothetical protein